MSLAPRLDATLIVGGPYHDMDYVRLELLAQLARHERVRTRVAETYPADLIAEADLLITYTCDRMPDAAATEALEGFLERGGRWFALHGTNSRMVLDGDAPVRCPALPERLRAMLGSQFQAHPAPGRYKVRPTASEHPLVAGLEPFFVEDEQYLQDHDAGNEPLLTTRFGGETPLFERSSWPEAEHQVMYLRPRGAGAVLYLTLGHARGRYDMRPVAETYPFVERGAWVHPTFRELIARGIGWAMREPPYA